MNAIWTGSNRCQCSILAGESGPFVKGTGGVCLECTEQLEAKAIEESNVIVVMQIGSSQEEALSDGAQSLTFENFDRLMKQVTDIRKVMEQVSVLQ